MTAIEWTHAPGTRGETWNPIVGCSIVSPGCTNCYAMRMASRLEAIGIDHYTGLTTQSKAGAVWTGRLMPAPDSILAKPFHWRRPRTVFVNSMGDLFHNDVPDLWISRVWGTMALNRDHTFIILTKRAERMRDYVANWWFALAESDAMIPHPTGDARFRDLVDYSVFPSRPLPNVWLGVSAERQTEANERIPHLIETPAALRLVSIEPMLGPVDLRALSYTDPATMAVSQHDALAASGPRLDWVIVGGESGSRARPMHTAWVRSVRAQCMDAGVPLFMKQWGEWEDVGPAWGVAAVGEDEVHGCSFLSLDGHVARHREDSSPGARVVRRVGKGASGFDIDGVEFRQWPRQVAA